ncbi:MAG: hypothetical protein LBI47_01060 [Puniceicoccales bacterium]|jgi:hypothetical protein|nr:hypothetical protein [Puniceicoccales bacterium]
MEEFKPHNYKISKKRLEFCFEALYKFNHKKIMTNSIFQRRLEGANGEPGVKSINVKPYSQVAAAWGTLLGNAEYPNLGEVFQRFPSALKLIARYLTVPKTNWLTQWIYDPSSRRIKLKLPIQAALFLMKAGDLLFKFSGPVATFHITLKVTLCIIATAQVFMASDKLRSSIASPGGLGNLFLALIFPLFADAIPYFYGMWSVEMANWYTVVFASVCTVFLQAFLEKEGFKDVLSATTSIRELMGPNLFLERVPKVAQDLWKISHNLANGYCAVETLVLSSKKVLTSLFRAQGS